MAKPLRVGIIGANASGGWAREGHIPAIQRLNGLELVAVATNSRQSAEAAAAAFGAPAAFANGIDLVRAAGIDLVTIAAPIQSHRELVLAALAEGKHVYSEWPLGRGYDETAEMAAAAQVAGIHAAIGLQLRGSPIVQEAHRLITSGTIGRVLSVRAYSATAGFGPTVPEPYLYLEDPANFANLITIQGGHTIDLIIALAGGFSDLSALATMQYAEIKAGENGEKRSRITFDHLLLQGRLVAGGTFSVEVAGGRPPETPFYLELIGETGIMRLDGGAARGVQAGRLTLSLDGAKQALDEGELALMPDAAANVAGIYAGLRDDIAHATFSVPDFGHAAKLTQLITDLLSASRTGTRIQASGWPER